MLLGPRSANTGRVSRPRDQRTRYLRIVHMRCRKFSPAAGKLGPKQTHRDAATNLRAESSPSRGTASVRFCLVPRPTHRVDTLGTRVRTPPQAELHGYSGTFGLRDITLYPGNLLRNLVYQIVGCIYRSPGTKGTAVS